MVFFRHFMLNFKSQIKNLNIIRSHPKLYIFPIFFDFTRFMFKEV